VPRIAVRSRKFRRVGCLLNPRGNPRRPTHPIARGARGLVTPPLRGGPYPRTHAAGRLSVTAQHTLPHASADLGVRSRGMVVAARAGEGRRRRGTPRLAQSPVAEGKGIRRPCIASSAPAVVRRRPSGSGGPVPPGRTHAPEPRVAHPARAQAALPVAARGPTTRGHPTRGAMPATVWPEP